MALAGIAGGITWPVQHWNWPQGVALATQIDAVGEKGAHIGRLYIDGRPSSPKTLSSAGGKIWFIPGPSTIYATGTTSTTLGIQGVSASAGPIAQPDGAFGARCTLVGGVWTFNGGQWNTNNITSGSSSLSHGQLIAVVWDMTARGGTDRLDVVGHNNIVGNALSNYVSPTTNAFAAGAWQTIRTIGALNAPLVVIEFDDGTIGWFDATVPTRIAAVQTFNDTTTPDEIGMKFQVPWDCKIDALWAHVGSTTAAADFTLKLYSAPLTAPNALVSLPILAEQGGNPGGQAGMLMYPITEISLARNTDYAVTVRAGSSSNNALQYILLPDTAHRVILPNGMTLAKVSRSDDTGNLVAESPAVTMHAMGVRISALDDGTGSGGAFGSANMLGGMQ